MDTLAGAARAIAAGVGGIVGVHGGSGGAAGGHDGGGKGMRPPCGREQRQRRSGRGDQRPGSAFPRHGAVGFSNNLYYYYYRDNKAYLTCCCGDVP